MAHTPGIRIGILLYWGARNDRKGWYFVTIEQQQRIVQMRGTKADCIALTAALEEGAVAYATDTAQLGIYTNGAFVWISSTAGHTIQNQGVSLPVETNLNFAGGGVIASDNAGASATNVQIETAINVYNETITADGISTIYYLANIANPATIRVYIDGIRQPATDDVAATDVVTFSVAPDLGAVLLFDYEMDLT